MSRFAGIVAAGKAVFSLFEIVVEQN